MGHADGGWTVAVDDAEAVGELDGAVGVGNVGAVGAEPCVANADRLVPSRSGTATTRAPNRPEIRIRRLGANQGAEPYSHADCRP